MGVSPAPDDRPPGRPPNAVRHTPESPLVTTANVVFLIVLVLASGYFAYSAQRLYAFAVGVGRPEDRTDHPGRRLWNLLTIGLAQTKILRDPIAGLMHALVFWGFCVITAGTAEMMVQGVCSATSMGSYRCIVVPFLERSLFFAGGLPWCSPSACVKCLRED